MKIINSSSGFQTITYQKIDTPFGKAIVASSQYGLCFYGFTDDISDLRRRFPQSNLIHGNVNLQCDSLHVNGTQFQIKIWTALLGIPRGEVITYGELAAMVGSPKAQRAVGSAVGSNPIALLIPCHRVVGAQNRSSYFKIGGYHWGTDIKIKILESETISNHTPAIQHVTTKNPDPKTVCESE